MQKWWLARFDVRLASQSLLAFGVTLMEAKVIAFHIPLLTFSFFIFHFNFFNDPATLPSDWTLPKRQLKRLK